MSEYDDAYAKDPALFGVEPEPWLLEHTGALDRAMTVLDVGAGQGRHTLYLARRGFNVVALDPSAVAAETLARSAAREGLRVDVRQEPFEVHGEGGYGAILVFGLLPILGETGLSALRELLARGLASGGLAFVTAFTDEDARFGEIASSWEALGDGVFGKECGERRRFVPAGTLPSLFPELEPLAFRERVGPWHRHGDSAPERHALAELLVRRPRA